MRLLLCLSVTVLLSASTLAQDSPSNAVSLLQSEQVRGEVDRLFNSGSIRDRAWAAYFAGRYGLKEYAPLLIDLIQESSNDQRDDARIAYRVFVDSLIQLDVPVSADQLMPFYKRSPDEVMILLAKSPKDSQEALLSIAKQAEPKKDSRVYWLAACNLLAETGARGLAAHLLSELTIELSVVVTDPYHGEGVGAGGGGCVAGLCGSNGPRLPNAFPPEAFYLLSDQPSNGSVVVAAGPHTIYYQRIVVGADKGCPDFSGRNGGWNKNSYALDYLAKLLGTTPDVLGFKNRHSRTVVWKNADEYSQTIRMYRREILRSYDELKNRLIERELLSASESASLPPKIVMTILDARQNRAVKLPEL